MAYRLVPVMTVNFSARPTLSGGHMAVQSVIFMLAATCAAGILGYSRRLDPRETRMIVATGRPYRIDVVKFSGQRGPAEFAGVVNVVAGDTCIHACCCTPFAEEDAYEILSCQL